MKTASPKHCRWWLIPAWAAENVRLLIVLAYTVVKLPFSLRMIKAAFYSIDTELEDAARNMGATFASSYGTSYAMVIQSMCAEEGLYGYNVNASGRRCASTVFIMIVSGIILYLVYGVGGRDLGERLEAKARLPRHLHGTAEYLVRRWNDPIVPVEGMADVARDLKNAGMAGIVFHGDTAHLRCQLADRGIL